MVITAAEGWSTVCCTFLKIHSCLKFSWQYLYIWIHWFHIITLYLSGLNEMSIHNSDKIILLRYNSLQY